MGTETKNPKHEELTEKMFKETITNTATPTLTRLE